MPKGIYPGNQNWSEERRRQLSLLQKGLHRSPSTEFKKGDLHSKYWLGKNISEDTKKKISLSQKGKRRNEESPFWKGDNVGYRALHNWIENTLGKASLCEIDTSHKSKIYNWANISGEYRRDLSDWRQLCRSCHNKDDVPMHSRFKNSAKPDQYDDTKI
jgi:hypothetical protein